MRRAAAYTLFSLVLGFPIAASAAEAPAMPANGAKVECVVSVLVKDALLVQCGELFAGTVMTVPAGGYGGMLICEEKKAMRCPDVIPATVQFDGLKFAQDSLNGAAVFCTVKSMAGVVTFICTQ